MPRQPHPRRRPAGCAAAGPGQACCAGRAWGTPGRGARGGSGACREAACCARRRMALWMQQWFVAPGCTACALKLSAQSVARSTCARQVPSASCLLAHQACAAIGAATASMVILAALLAAAWLLGGQRKLVGPPRQSEVGAACRHCAGLWSAKQQRRCAPRATQQSPAAGLSNACGRAMEAARLGCCARAKGDGNAHSCPDLPPGGKRRQQGSSRLHTYKVSTAPRPRTGFESAPHTTAGATCCPSPYPHFTPANYTARPQLPSYARLRVQRNLAPQTARPRHHLRVCCASRPPRANREHFGVCDASRAPPAAGSPPA
jgi:hypothetical protein